LVIRRNCYKLHRHGSNYLADFLPIPFAVRHVLPQLIESVVNVANATPLPGVASRDAGWILASHAGPPLSRRGLSGSGDGVTTDVKSVGGWWRIFARLRVVIQIFKRRFPRPVVLDLKNVFRIFSSEDFRWCRHIEKILQRPRGTQLMKVEPVSVWNASGPDVSTTKFAVLYLCIWNQIFFVS